MINFIFNSNDSKELYFFSSVKVILYLAKIDSKVSVSITLWIWYLIKLSSEFTLLIIVVLSVVFISSLGSSTLVSSSFGSLILTSLRSSCSSWIFSLGSDKSITSALVVLKNSSNDFSSANSITLCSPLIIYSTLTCNSSSLLNS